MADETGRIYLVFSAPTDTVRVTAQSPDEAITLAASQAGVDAARYAAVPERNYRERSATQRVTTSIELGD